MTTLWATSDLHFGHKQAVAGFGRPFKDADDMDEQLIERFNAVVGKTDVTYLLGDVSFRTPGQTRALVARLRGRIVLVAGNHDDRRIRKMERWSVVREAITVEHDGYRIEMCHFPPRHISINPLDLRTLWLHGHLHSKTPGVLPLYDVGVDANDWAPVRLDDIVAEARQREQSIQNLKNLIGG